MTPGRASAMFVALRSWKLVVAVLREKFLPKRTVIIAGMPADDAPVLRQATAHRAAALHLVVCAGDCCFGRVRAACGLLALSKRSLLIIVAALRRDKPKRGLAGTKGTTTGAFGVRRTDAAHWRHRRVSTEPA